MNSIYRIIWSEAQQAFVVVSELAKGHSRAKRRATEILSVSLLGLSIAYADPALTQLPTGGQITQGSGTISQ
ncbi:MAG: ESPR domain-containing protein, partial [Methylococcaceae bacterium]